jgi:hypothetical protein
MDMTHYAKLALPLASALLLAACGGASDSKTNNAGSGSTGDNGGVKPPAAVVQSFSAKAQWALKPTAGSSTCFDFDSNKDVACEGSAWDMKASLGAGSRDSVQFFTNSGPKATGKGGALGDTFNFTWAQLAELKDTSKMPDGNPLLPPMFIIDSMNNAFASDNAYGGTAFEYAEQKIHVKYPVYLVTLNSAEAYSASSSNIYAVQLAGYYGGDTGNKSANIKVRYVKLSELGNDGAVKEVSVDASQGWAYLDLTSGATVAADGTWHLGMNRYNVVTNSGASGSGTVGSFVAQELDDFYADDGKVIVAKLSDPTLVDKAKNMLTNNSAWSTPSAANKWEKDTLKSPLNPAYKGDPFTGIDYGFYSYTGMNANHPSGAGTHKFLANPERGVLLRSGEGNSYARVHLSSIAEGIYTFDFDVAPAVAK